MKMLFYGIFLVLFWVVIIIYPELLAYIVASFFIIAGINILVFYFMLKRAEKETEEIIIGSYKVIKK